MELCVGGGVEVRCVWVDDGCEVCVGGGVKVRCVWMDDGGGYGSEVCEGG